MTLLPDQVLRLVGSGSDSDSGKLMVPDQVIKGNLYLIRYTLSGN